MHGNEGVPDPRMGRFRGGGGGRRDVVKLGRESQKCKRRKKRYTCVLEGKCTPVYT